MRRTIQIDEASLPDVFARLDRDAFLADAARLVEEEVLAQTGVAGFAIRGAYRLVAGLRPGFLADALRQLYPAFAVRLGETVARKTAAQSYEDLFAAERAQVATALLAVADARAARIQLRAVRAAYEKIRRHSEESVRRAAPRLGALLDRHVR